MIHVPQRYCTFKMSSYDDVTDIGLSKSRRLWILVQSLIILTPTGENVKQSCKKSTKLISRAKIVV